MLERAHCPRCPCSHATQLAFGAGLLVSATMFVSSRKLIREAGRETPFPGFQLLLAVEGGPPSRSVVRALPAAARYARFWFRERKRPSRPQTRGAPESPWEQQYVRCWSFRQCSYCQITT